MGACMGKSNKLRPTFDRPFPITETATFSTPAPRIIYAESRSINEPITPKTVTLPVAAQRTRHRSVQREAVPENQRLFGAFNCPQCKRTWMSACTWANTGQNCLRCGDLILPFKQQPLEKPEGLDKSDPEKGHMQSHCQKCKQLGHSCLKYI